MYFIQVSPLLNWPDIWTDSYCDLFGRGTGDYRLILNRLLGVELVVTNRWHCYDSCIRTTVYNYLLAISIDSFVHISLSLPHVFGTMSVPWLPEPSVSLYRSVTTLRSELGQIANSCRRSGCFSIRFVAIVIQIASIVVINLNITSNMMKKIYDPFVIDRFDFWCFTHYWCQYLTYKFFDCYPLSPLILY